MAWQLIYTSAPRLLEAGRTGFGTVARHRAVGGMLASTVERLSQFARLPGHDPRRIVHAHRIVTVGGGTFHVLSCLRDAGSDYTGRTNHLAHHLIAEAREARALSSAGITPADVLIAMNWRTSWADGPRFLDAAEEVDLSTLRAAPASAWTALTGNPDYARLLAAPQALKGCYVIVPPAVDALALFRESLLAASQAGWQTSFTTCLEPNDDVGDFRWIGLPPDSPLRGQAEVSNRLLLDLTQPSKLPAPPEPPAKPQLVTEPEPATPVTLNSTGPTRSPDKVSLKRPPAQPAPITQLGGWSPESSRKAPKKRTKALLLAFLAVSVLVASIAGFLLWQHISSTNAQAAFQDKVKVVWDRHGLALAATRKSLGSELDLAKGSILLDSLDAYVKGMRQLLQNADPKLAPPLPEDTANLPDFEALQKAFEDWREVDHQAPTKTGADVSDLLRLYDEWLERRNKCWKSLSVQVGKIGQMPDVAPGVRGKWLDTAKKLLREHTPGLPEREAKEVNKRFGQDKEINNWLEIWGKLNSDSSIVAAEQAQRDNSLPEWLKTKAAKVLAARDKALADKKKSEEEVMKAAAAKAAAAKKLQVEDADSLDGKHPIFIFLLKKGSTSVIINEANGLPLEPDMNVYVGGAWDKHPNPDGTSDPKTKILQRYNLYEVKYYKNEFNTKEQNVGFGETGEQITLSEDLLNSDEGCRIVARSKDNSRVLFDVRIVPESGALTRAVLWQTVTAAVVNDTTVKLHEISLLLSRLKGWATLSPAYRLRFEGSISEQVIYTIKAANENTYTVEVPAEANKATFHAAQLRKEIASLQAGIKTDEDALKKNEASNLAAKEKEEKQRKYSDAKSAKEVQLQDKTAELKEIESQKPPTFELKPGTYMLLEGMTQVCRLDVRVSSKSPKP